MTNYTIFRYKNVSKNHISWGKIYTHNAIYPSIELLCPRHVMAGEYSVTLFRHSVLPSFRPSILPFFRHSVIPSSSVSVHYLKNSCTHLNQIWHMDMSWENTGQVRIWSWFDDFWQSYAPLTLKIIWNFQFPFIISQTIQHIQLKLDIWICHEIIQVKFEFCHGLMIFGRVMPLLLWK
jgi:hypothetical protein